MTAAEQWVAIVNLRAGGRVRTDDFATRLRPAVSRVFVSERPGHVDELVQCCLEADGILVAGGDGTLFEVLQACDRSRQKIALLPAGRGNSLARDLGVVSRTDVADVIRRGTDRAIDLLNVTLLYDDGDVWNGVSASNVAVGYPAGVARDAGRWRRLGASSYAVGAVTASIDRMLVRLSCDGGASESRQLTGLVISNSRYVGPFLGFPSADLCDGICHTVEMRVGRARQMLHNLSSLSGLGFYEPVARKDLRRIDARFDRPVLVKIDGEMRTAVREINAAMSPGAVTFRVPAARHA